MAAGSSDWEFARALIFAGVSGLIMGIGPERKGRAAGLRTHVYVAVGAALFSLISLDFAGLSPEALRALQGVTLGVGFVGAATVLHREGQVTGVSTAAQIWVAAALGSEAAFGHPYRAVVVAAAVVICSTGLRILERYVLHTKNAGD